jgi:ABC-type transporter Mla subunit MlaD
MQTLDALDDWLGVLGRVEASLQQSLRDLDAQEQSFGASEADGQASEFASAWQRCLDQIDGRLRRLSGLIESADRFAAEADADLAGTRDVVDEWSAALAATGRRLADPPAPVVS